MIPKETVAKVLKEALSNGGDLAEIYIEDRLSTAFGLEDSKLERAVRGADRGAGIRVFYGHTAAYAYTDDLSVESLLQAAQGAAAAAKGGGRGRILDFTRRDSPLDFPVEKGFDTMAEQAKADLLHQIDVTARGYDPRVNQVQAGYTELRRRVWIYNSEGLWAEDDRSMVEVRVRVMARKDGIIQRATQGFGGQMGLELLDRHDALALTKEVAETAVKMLDARPAPAGEMTVVMNHGWGGVLFHEACGHAMEADFITKGTSAYYGKKGEQVASPLVTAVDDGTLPGRRGSMRYDDDGTPTERTVLIEKGILKEYMWDLAEARRGNYHSTGNGRRQSFRYAPVPRMTNTFIDAGQDDPEEIVRSVKKGLYVKNLGGGQADIAKGDFVFSVTEGYLIEDGRLTAPVRGATLIGNGPKVLAEIDMVGHDLELDKGMGMCGKMQGARVSVGQPTIRIPRLTVGGTDQEFKEMV
ncbi:MAG: TldD/PmbA family protein [Anaerolineae bacterium]